METLSPIAQIEMEYIIGKHLFLYGAKKCSCGLRGAGVMPGKAWSWYIGHLAEELSLAGYSKAGSK